MRNDKCSADERSVKIIAEYDHNWNDQIPTPCSSSNIEGELVISTNHPFSWSTHMTDCGTSYEMMKLYHQKCLIAKRNALAAIQDASCNFNVNCVAVQESLKT